MAVDDAGTPPYRLVCRRRRFRDGARGDAEPRDARLRPSARSRSRSARAPSTATWPRVSAASTSSWSTARRRRARQVAAAHGQGTVVLGYLSVGTIERGRFWYRDVKRYRLDLWDDFGEWYADTSKRGYREADHSPGRARACCARASTGCSSTTSTWSRRTGRRRAGCAALVTDAAHAATHLLFAQNGDDSIRPLVERYLDGWNREDVTWTYDFDRRRYVRVAGGRRARRAGRAAPDGRPRAARDGDRLRRRRATPTPSRSRSRTPAPPARCRTSPTSTSSACLLSRSPARGLRSTVDVP